MRRLLKIVAPIALAAGLVATTATSASADDHGQGTGYAGVSQSTANGGDGNAWVYWMNQAGTSYLSVKDSNTYARAWFGDFDTSFSMNAWLDRSTDGGQSWHRISGLHALNSASPTDAQFASTYAYYDGPGYLARACFQFTSWSGAAVHCTAGI